MGLSGPLIYVHPQYELIHLRPSIHDLSPGYAAASLGSQGPGRWRATRPDSGKVWPRYGSFEFLFLADLFDSRCLMDLFDGYFIDLFGGCLDLLVEFWTLDFLWVFFNGLLVALWFILVDSGRGSPTLWDIVVGQNVIGYMKIGCPKWLFNAWGFSCGEWRCMVGGARWI